MARRKGQEDRESANLVLSQALAVTILLAVVVSLLTVAFAPQILRLAGSNPDTHRDAVLYYRIILQRLLPGHQRRPAGGGQHPHRHAHQHGLQRGEHLL